MLPFEKKREMIILEEDKGNLGVEPNKRKINEYLKYGIINLDKPSGPTSHQVSYWVKEILNLKKVGHGGTLDPKVTGILPILLEKSTKIEKTLQKGGKEYITLMHIHCDLDKDKIIKKIKKFVGDIIQIPPIKSHVKRVPRKRRIYYLDILEIDGRDVLFKVGVEGGTYIRKLCHDIGLALGCGAHMAELRRTKSAGLNENDHLVTLQDVEDAYAFFKEGNEKFLRYVVQPVENIIFIPKIWVFDEVINRIIHGSPLFIPGISKFEKFNRDEDIAIMSLKGELIGIGKSVVDWNVLLKKKKGLAVKTDAVLKEPF